MRWWVMAAAMLAAVVALNVGSPVALVAQQGTKDDCLKNPLGPVTGTPGVDGGFGYSIVTHGDADLMNTESDGRVVFGGNAALGPYGVGKAAVLPLDPQRVDLAVGGNLIARWGLGVNQGRVTYGGTLTLPGPGVAVTNGASQAAPPFDGPGLFD